jgi:hypothetical protein
MECGQCGDTLTAEDDEGLVKAAKQHFAEEHSFLPVTEERIREIVAASARDA